jgi:predicted peptidase
MKRISLVLAGLLFPAVAGAADPEVGFLDRVHKDPDGKEAKYVLFVPHDYKGDRAYPLILFLHGAGETGFDGHKQARTGLGRAIRKREKDFPFFVLFPQSQKRTWKADSPDADRALAILDETQKKYKIDPDRVYLTGLSMGGFGTWSLAFHHHDRWAAIVPICGGGDPRGAERIKDIPCWCFHGDKDRAVRVDLSRRMIEALKKAGAKPKYTEYEGVGHNCWDRAYATEELYDWLLKQRRKK